MSIYIYNLNQIDVNGENKFGIHIARKGCDKPDHDFVPLLLLSDNHVCLIRDFKKFICQFRKFLKRENIVDICYRCLTPFRSEEDCQNHSSVCESQTTVIYSQPGEKYKFHKYHTTYKASHVCFLDMEAFNKKCDNSKEEGRVSCQSSFAYSYTIVNA